MGCSLAEQPQDATRYILLQTSRRNIRTQAVVLAGHPSGRTQGGSDTIASQFSPYPAPNEQHSERISSYASENNDNYRPSATRTKNAVPSEPSGAPTAKSAAQTQRTNTGAFRSWFCRCHCLVGGHWTKHKATSAVFRDDKPLSQVLYWFESALDQNFQTF